MMAFLLQRKKVATKKGPVAKYTSFSWPQFKTTSHRGVYRQNGLLVYMEITQDTPPSRQRFVNGISDGIWTPWDHSNIRIPQTDSFFSSQTQHLPLFCLLLSLLVLLSERININTRGATFKSNTTYTVNATGDRQGEPVGDKRCAVVAAKGSSH
jgi:hypothetical protein